MRGKMSILVIFLAATLASAAGPEPASVTPAARELAPVNLTNTFSASNLGNFSLGVYGMSPDGTDAGGEALARVVAGVLYKLRLRAHAQPPPAACRRERAPASLCVNETIKGLQQGRDPRRMAHVALLPVAATAVPGPRDLSDVGLLDLGDAAAPWRRACLATAPPARSLLDLADRTLASFYSLSHQYNVPGLKCENNTFTPEWCDDECAVILTSTRSEAEVLAAVVREHRLFVNIIPCSGLADLVANIRSTNSSIIVCDRALELFTSEVTSNATWLGPPPCVSAGPCPFEPMRLKLYANNMTLARYPSALWHLENLFFGTKDLYKLTSDALRNDSQVAAENFLVSHPLRNPFVQLRVAVLYPNRTKRQSYDARSLVAAAQRVEKAHDNRERPASFKVELFDDRCSPANAYAYLTHAHAQGDYGTLSAVAGPACGAAFASVARQVSADNVPVLAYTPQAPPPPPAAELALLAAGDARDHPRALLALAAALAWRRLALLRDAGSRAAFELAELQAFDLTATDLPEDEADLHTEQIQQWATRMAQMKMRVLYVALEDAREVRAALCAGRAAGLVPAAGAVWVLPSALPAGWLAERDGDGAGGGCAPAHLEEAAEGHLTVAPAWLAEWAEPAAAAWTERCAGCAPAAAALYDALHLWATALELHLDSDFDHVPDNWHRETLVKKLIRTVTSKKTEGITGLIEWSTSVRGAHVRIVPLVLQQWRNGSYVPVGRWENGTLALERAALRWGTADGRAPDDGRDACGLQALADALGGDCRAAFVTLAALLLGALAAGLTALAVCCRRRAEREYRAHLELLRLRSGGLKPGGLDRWEVPRERVVINRKLGTGAFGTVYGGHALLAEDRGWTAVAVKTLKAGATTEEKLDFLSEAEAMKRFDHKNVVRLLAVVTKTEPVCTVMEFMLYGDLKNYLLARRHLAVGEPAAGDEDAIDEVSPRRLTGMALDVSRALSYLAQLRYVHRDVAARNCLVSASRVVKLADFGMTRLVFENDYYRFSRKGMLPVRWMAPESLALGVFSPASDVWSFGVLLYEVVTFGSLPFQGLSNSEVLARVKAGHTLDLPRGMKPQLEGLIKSCWRQDYKTRPVAAEIAAFLADSPRLLAPCLDVPLDALPLDVDPPCDRAEARWVSWAAPASATTETTYLSTDAPHAHETDAFLS